VAAEAGSTATILVPDPSGLSTSKRPPTASTRSRRPTSPDPAVSVAPPRPSSAISIRRWRREVTARTSILVAPACLLALASASQKTK
jgi:hypothetical protein